MSTTRQRWAVLHGRDTLAAGAEPTSDIDVAADITGPAVLAHAVGQLQRERIYPIVLNQYDVGRSDAFWLFDVDDGTVLEWDVMSDPHGRGRLGIPTRLALARATPDRAGWPSVTAEWSAVYQVSKRLWKRQWHRLPDIDLSGCSVDRLRAVLRVVFGKHAGDRARLLLETSADEARWRNAHRILGAGRTTERWLRRPRNAVVLPGSRMARVLDRLRARVGFWVHVSGGDAEAVARQVHVSIGTGLPRHVCCPSSAVTRSPRRMVLVIAPVVIRPGLATTWGGRPLQGRSVTPDLVVDAADGIDHAVRSTVTAMSQRVQARLDVPGR